MVDRKPRSRDVTEGMERAPARAMLRAVGLTDDDWDKPQIGVASSWNEITPCNLSLDRLAKAAKVGVRDAGGMVGGDALFDPRYEAEMRRFLIRALEMEGIPVPRGGDRP